MANDPKVCPYCGVEFVPIRLSHKTCGSDNCKSANKKQWAKKYSQLPEVKKRWVILRRKPARIAAKKERYAKYMSLPENKRKRAKYHRLRAKAKRSLNEALKTKRCPYCLMEFEPKTSKQTICASRECTLVKEKAHRDNPANKAAHRAYCSTQEQKEKAKKHRATLEYKEGRGAYDARPENKARRKKSRSTPDSKKKQKMWAIEYNNRPDVIKRRKEWCRLRGASERRRHLIATLFAIGRQLKIFKEQNNERHT